MKYRQLYLAVWGFLVMTLFGCIPDVEIPQITLDTPFSSTNSTDIVFKASASPMAFDQCGFYISKEPQMSYKPQFEAQVSSSFSVNYKADMDQLGSTLYYQAYVKKGESIATSNVERFVIPQFSKYVTLTEPQVYMEKNGKAKVTFQINWAAGISLIEQGVCYSTEFSSPTYFNSYVERADIQNSTCTIQLDLISGKTYYLCGYARSNYHVAYSVPIVYVVPVLLPTVTTSAVNSITATTAQAGGSVTNTGSSDVSARGVVWSKNPEPTISLSTKTKDGTGTGTFTSKMTGLTPSTQYYVRAYATNSFGTAYGEEKTFTTTVNIPTVVMRNIGLTHSSASVESEVASDGGSAVTARGVVWSTSPSPTINLSTKTYDGSGTGLFGSSISGLKPETEYYVRAYATNSAGTAYSTQWNIKTPADSRKEAVIKAYDELYDALDFLQGIYVGGMSKNDSVFFLDKLVNFAKAREDYFEYHYNSTTDARDLNYFYNPTIGKVRFSELSYEALRKGLYDRGITGTTYEINSGFAQIAEQLLGKSVAEGIAWNPIFNYLTNVMTAVMTGTEYPVFYNLYVPVCRVEDNRYKIIGFKVKTTGEEYFAP